MKDLVTNPETRKIQIIGARGYSAYHSINLCRVGDQWVPEAEFRQNGRKGK